MPIPQEFEQKLSEANERFNTGTKVYKDAQNILAEIDIKIHLEFGYCARALVDISNAIIKGEIDDNFDSNAWRALENYRMSTKHILNDVVDLIFIHAKLEIDRLNQISKYTGITQVYPDYHTVHDTLDDVSDIISLSRQQRGQARRDAYIKMIDDGIYKPVLDFCKKIPRIEEDLKKARRKEISDNRKYAGAYVIGIIGALIGVIGAALKF